MSVQRSKAKGIRLKRKHWWRELALCLILILASLSVSLFLYPLLTSAQGVTNVNSPTPNGYYAAGDDIIITITFNEAVKVTGTPLLELETGATDRIASYTGPSGSDTLTFRYTVQEGDTSSDLDYRATDSLKLNGGTIKDASGDNNATLTLAAPSETGSLGDNKNLVIDTTAPIVDNVTSSNIDRIYSTDEIINITITFSEPVFATGTPLLGLETGNTDRVASYASGSGSSTLTFRYKVQEGDSSSDLDYKTTNSLILSGGTIRDAADNDAILTLATPGTTGSLGDNKDLVINTNTRVTDVNSDKGNGTYSTGEVIDISVTFSEVVEVTGTPLLELETGTTDSIASYISGSGTDTMIFRYTVQQEDSSPDLDYRATDSLKLNDGIIKDTTGNNAELTLPAPGESGSLSYNKDLVIGTNTRVANVTSDKSNGTYSTGEVIDIAVIFSEEVEVTGTPLLELETGTTDRDASYISGSGTDTLTFRYTVKQGDSSPDLDYRATDSLKLNDGIIKDTTGDNAELALAAPGKPGSLGANKTLKIDAFAPTVTSVTSPNANGTYTKGQVIDVTVIFSEQVNVTGTPYLELETGTTDHNTSCISGSGTDTLTFRYTIREGDFSPDLDYRATDSLKLNGGTIKDAAGNDASLMLAVPGKTGSLGLNKALVINADPTVNYEERFPGIDIESIYITIFRNQAPTEIDAIDRADTKVYFSYPSLVTGEVMIAKYKEEPAFPAVQFSGPGSEGGAEKEGIKFVDIYVSGFNEEIATIMIYYSDDEINGLNEDTLSLFYWDGSTWQEIENIFRYTDTNIIRGEIPVSALSGTPIGLGGNENEDQGQNFTLFIVLGTIGSLVIIAVLIWLFWDYRRKQQKAYWTSVKTPKNVGLPGR